MSGYNNRGGGDHGYYGHSQDDSNRNHRGRDGRGRRDNQDNGGVGHYGRGRDDGNSHGGYGQYDRGDNGGGNGNNHYGRDRNRDFQSGGSYGRPDRSRSRDDRGRGGFGRGGGGRGFGRGGGRGGGRGFNGPRPSTLAVKTNYFKLEIVPTNGQIVEWVQYRVEIICAIRKKVFDDDKKFQGFDVVVHPKRGDKPIDIDKGSELSRRILRKLASDEQLSYASDGSCTAFSPKELFEGICHTYNVAVRQDCDEDEMDADLVKNSWFKVKFTKVANIVPTNVNALEPVRQAMDIILKSAMITVGMKAFGRSPRAFYFPEDLQPEVTNSRLLTNMMRNQHDFMPMIGLYQAAKFCEDGNAYVNTDTVVDFANREFKQLMGTKVPIHLLDENRSTICGIRVDLHNYITDERTRNEILQKLEKIRINMKFVRPMTPEFLERWRKKGLSDEEIERKNVKVRRNKFIKEDEKLKAKIIWGADDPNLYSFEMTKSDNEDTGIPSRKYTVYTYNKERYDLTLKFPKMPIVFLGNKEWFPLEFLYQTFGKMRAANSPEHVKAVLDYYNMHSGAKYMGNVSAVTEASNRIKRMGLNISDILKQYNLRKSSDPVKLEARVLQEPTLAFAEENAFLKNGDWSVMKRGNRRLKFKKPAEIKSFAVVNLAGERNPCAFDFMSNLLLSAKSHGLQTPDVDSRQVLTEIISHADSISPQGIHDAFMRAIDMAKEFFIYDTCRNFQEKSVLCRSRVKRQGLRHTAVKKDQAVYDCLLFPASNDKKAVGLILPSDVAFASHWIEVDGDKQDARLMIKVREKNVLVDPFNFRYDFQLRCHVALGDNGNWDRVTFERQIFQLGENSDTFVNEDQAQLIPKYMLNGKKIEKNIEVPSIVFVILPEKKAEYYGVTKMLSHFVFGIQTQCIIASNYQGQRSKEQYCSNVTIKVNAKLSSISNGAHAWSTHHHNVEGIPWVREAPTFVLGLSISNTLGQHAISIISASACLDSSCMRFAQDIKIQTKTEIIDDSVLIDLTKSLLIQFFLHNGKQMPERILVYRDGVSDGSFSRVQSREIQCIRKAFLKFKEEMTGQTGSSCDICKTSGCLLCCPLITFVVCMTRNKIKIVPANECGEKNVFSGTCLDDVIMDMQNLRVIPSREEFSSASNLIYTEPDGKGYDFILVAHGGRMGTSKTVHYRCILNENAVFKPSNPNATPLTKSTLELLTYQMSFQYSTASKAVRVVPVVNYSSRLANMVMHYYAYLRGTKGSEGEQIVPKKLDDLADAEMESDMGANKQSRSQFVRGDIQEVLHLPDHLKTSLLPKFAAFVETIVDDNDNFRYENRQYQAPFFTHISA